MRHYWPLHSHVKLCGRFPQAILLHEKASVRHVAHPCVHGRKCMVFVGHMPRRPFSKSITTFSMCFLKKFKTMYTKHFVHTTSQTAIHDWSLPKPVLSAIGRRMIPLRMMKQELTSQQRFDGSMPVCSIESLKQVLEFLLAKPEPNFMLLCPCLSSRDFESQWSVSYVPCTKPPTSLIFHILFPSHYITISQQVIHPIYLAISLTNLARGPPFFPDIPIYRDVTIRNHPRKWCRAPV